jgi:tetratricopeptide (TPR) repeat protein
MPLQPDDRSRLAESTVTLRGLRPGELIDNRWKIIRHIASGGMGDVYEAEDAFQTDRRVALKAVRPEIAGDPSMVERFKREVRIGQEVTDRNVCRVYDLGHHRLDAQGSDMLYMTMELLPGETLASRVKGTRLSIAEAFPLVRQMARGLSALHRAGYVHRDLKPANVMIVEQEGDSEPRAVITDLGLARRVAAGHLPDAQVGAGLSGTPEYMAPEQVTGGELSAATDIYSLGVVIYRLVTGTHPFAGANRIESANKRLTEPPRTPRDYLPDLDPRWEQAILRCLEQDPRNRYAAVEDVLGALDPGPGAPAPPEPVRRLGSTLRLAAAAAAVLVVLAGAWEFREWALARFRLVPSEKRVAVLRFDSVGREGDTSPFSDGLMETLTSKLAQLEEFQGSLSVVPARDIRKYQITSVRDAQREFGVNLAITGSVQRSPGGLHLIVNLVDAGRLRQLRSLDEFVVDSDPVAMQQGVVRDVAGLLDLELRPEALAKLGQGNTAVTGAYDFYLKGAGYLLSGRAGTDNAVAEFQRALKLDPNYALAHAGLGRAYWSRYLQTHDRQWIDLAWTESTRALELNPRIAPTHITYAILSSGTGQYGKAIEHARKAIEIDRTNYLGYIELAKAFDAMGQAKDAEETYVSAIRLHPNYWGGHMELGTFYYNHARYGDAEASYRRVTELVPDNPSGFTNLGGVYHLEGRNAEAERTLQQSIRIRPTEQALSNLATVYFFQGRHADAVPLLEQLVRNGTTNYTIWGNLGDAYRWSPAHAVKASGAYRQAIQGTRDALAVNPQDALALSAQGLYYAKLGNVGTAIAVSQRAVDLAPGDPEVLYDSAVVLEIVGRRAAAAERLKMALANGYSLSEVRADPEMKALRADSDFSENGMRAR